MSHAPIVGAPREPVRCRACGCDRFTLTYRMDWVKGSRYLNTAQPASMTCAYCFVALPAEDMPGYDADIITGSGQKSSVPPIKDGR